MQPNITSHQNGDARVNAANDPRVQRVEILTEELKCLLEHHNHAFDDEIIRREIDRLEHWVQCYHNNLVNVDTFSAASTALLLDLKSRLKLAADELQRLEGEGGNPATKEQTSETEETIKAVRRSEKLISNIEEIGNH